MFPRTLTHLALPLIALSAPALTPSHASAQAATLRDGTIVAWGDNTYGQLNVPVGNYSAIAGGALHAVALRTDGSLAAWGYNFSGQTIVPSGGFTAIAAGGLFSIALRSNGTVAAFGDNSQGQGSFPPSAFFSSIATGQNNSYALRSNGTIVALGSNSGQQLAVPPGAFTAVAGGYVHALALRPDGSIVAWGDNYYGQVSGAPTTGTYLAVAATQFASFALRDDSTIMAWGYPTDPQVANAPTDSGYVALSASGSSPHILALRADGSLAAWGDNTAGQLNAPTGIFTAVAAGQLTSYAIRGQTAYTGDLRTFGSGPTANLNRSITVSGAVTVESPLLVYNAASLKANGNLNIFAGAYLGSGGLFTTSAALNLTRPDNIQTAVTTYSPITAASLTGNADLYVATPVSLTIGLTPSPSYNAGLYLSPGSSLILTGTGSQSLSTLSNEGSVRIPSGGALTVPSYSGAGILNYGPITLGSSGSTPSSPVAELSSQLPISNFSTGLITARNALISAPLTTNDGAIAFTAGTNDVLGKLTNNGSLTITAGATVTFNDDIEQNGTFVIRQLGVTTSTAIFLGAFSGSGFTGGGTAYIEGDLTPGNSPTLATSTTTALYDGSLALAPTSRTILELAGLTPGTDYDQLQITGDLSLSGTLDLRLLSDFIPPYFPYTFNLITAASITGNFDQILLPTQFYAGGWTLERSSTAINISHYTVVPEPSAYVLLLAPITLTLRRPNRRFSSSLSRR